jgi:type I restriction enzyme R subunit
VLVPPPSFQEALSSQIPALRTLQRLGYTHLSPEECAIERNGRLGRVILERVLAGPLRRLNKIRFKGRDLALSEENIARGIQALGDVPFECLVSTSEKVYDLLTLGKSLDQTIEGETKGFNLRCIDWQPPRNNTFHVTAEFEGERTGSHETRRPDIVCFVNGIPFMVIECKRREEKGSPEQATHQDIRNCKADGVPQLFLYSKLILGLNKNDSSGTTKGTALGFWAKWRKIPDTKETKVIRVHPVGPQDGVVCGLLMNLELIRAGYQPTGMTKEPQPPGFQLLDAFTDELSHIVKQGFRSCFHSLGLA